MYVYNTFLLPVVIPFPHPCLSVLFYDPQTLLSAVSMATGVGLPTEAWWAHHLVQNRKQQLSSSQNPSVANSSAGRGRLLQPLPIQDGLLRDPTLYRPSSGNHGCCKIMFAIVRTCAQYLSPVFPYLQALTFFLLLLPNVS